MNNRTLYRDDGYHKGLNDGKRTGGKVKKSYIDNFLSSETRSLSETDSREFIKGWQEGFADGVRGVISKMVKNDNVLKNYIGHVYELELN